MVAVFTSLLDASLLSGPLPTALTTAAFVAFTLMLTGRSRRWWSHTLPITVGISGVVFGLAWLGLLVWQPFPDQLPASVFGWVAFGLLGIGAAVAYMAGSDRPRWSRVVALLVAAPLIVAVAAMQVDSIYGYRPTLRAALGLPASDEVDFGQVSASRDESFQPTSDRPLWADWQPDADMPADGVVTHAPIPGSRSGFAARQAEIYLPPAYLARSRPALPVLMLISGQPGAPRDWMVAGQVAHVMDSFAAAHRGLAPVVVVPDATGTALANPLCLDSTLGHAETYLTADVTDWVRQNLQVDSDTHHWAVGGFSYGGTCALQLAVRHPALFPTFLDIGGDEAPSLGTPIRTAQAAFNGDTNKLRALSPMTLLTTGQYPKSAGLLASGTRDQDSVRENTRVAAAARKSGMTVDTMTVPGAHTWILAGDVLSVAIPWIASRVALTPPSPHSDLSILAQARTNPPTKQASGAAARPKETRTSRPPHERHPAPLTSRAPQRTTLAEPPSMHLPPARTS